MIRLRNESDLLQETLDHLAEIADGIVVYDDASTDGSTEIALAHPAVVEVIRNRRWRSSNRVWEETANRRLLHQRTLRYRPDWLFYADADERFEVGIREYLLASPAHVGGLRVSLFDAYMTPDDHEPFERGRPLWGFRTWFGPERRRILMAWRRGRGADFKTPDAREPQGLTGELVEKFTCQHYGKALSEAQWEETCTYYVDHFPEYRDKWQARRGKAIHTQSDFSTPLYRWPDVVSHAIDI